MVRDGEPHDASQAPAVPSEDVMRHVFEAAPSAMMLVDAEGLIRMANRHCEQLFGYTRSELMGRAVEMLVPQRFHIHQQAAYGDRHVYAALTRFVPAEIAQRFFEIVAESILPSQSATSAPGAAPLAASGLGLDLQAQARSMWS